MPFTYTRIIRFADVDPAGIVFYPRYFEMINETVEDWFAHGLGADFARMTLEQRRGVPVVHIDIDFKTPGKLYETLTFDLSVTRCGRSSIALRIVASCQETLRFEARLVLAYINLDTGRAIALPADLRTRIERELTVAPST